MTAITVVLAIGTAGIQPAAADGWLPTWSASQQRVWEPNFFPPVGIPRAIRDQTLRQVARVSLGGRQVRVRFSNLYGTQPLHIGAAHVAISAGGAAINAGSDRVLTFGGKPSITIPPGAPAVSDPVDLDVPALASLAVSTYLPDVSPTTTWHNDARQTAYLSASSNQTSAESFEAAQTFPSRIFLEGILIDKPADGRTVVLFGDSITDGDGSTRDANHRWPDFLAERLHEKGVPVAVSNQGISGARVLRDQLGDNALARFDRDVLSQPGVDTVVLMMGINDIGWEDTLLVPKTEKAPSADEIITGYKQLIARAHDEGLRIVGATLTPFENTFAGTPLFGYYSEEKEAKREQVNSFIRSGAFDAFIDFDAALRDPANPKHIRAEYDAGDHLHPNDAGYKAMADAVDLAALGVK
ncbi:MULTISPECIES: SGNH/GDSL hydrolase family protein [unclassified Aureimonas]|uniref:SGNH/GDSL hydrolase family protein n=1 Tax=unclassified Aureimonas TaxID=2615206 RepID=UPI001FCDAAF7|nr:MULTISPECIES: SGNH/GDSL hydrolase family protein [unclassified Aureimonas]